jgi:hypothetical protein
MEALWFAGHMLRPNSRRRPSTLLLERLRCEVSSARPFPRADRVLTRTENLLPHQPT